MDNLVSYTINSVTVQLKSIFKNCPFSMGNFSNFYEVLNISKNSSAEEIRKAYIALARKWHPDKHPVSSKVEAEARFKAVSEAYEALKDQETRSFSYNTINNAVNIKKANNSKTKSRPIEMKLECTLEELFWGCQKEVEFITEVSTKTGLILQKIECHTIEVLPGWRNETRIIFEPVLQTSSDHVFIISEKPHPFFKRVNDDLVLKVRVPLANALSGWSFSFRHLNGEVISCSFRDEVVFSGHEKVYRGKGMPVVNEDGVRGNLIIRFEIDFPRRLNGKQRKNVLMLPSDTI